MMKTYYHYVRTAEEQKCFIAIPKVMLKNKEFSGLSAEAKILYGLLLDRTRLSKTNKWVDSERRVYVIYQIADIQEDFNGCCRRKAIAYLKELEDLGLIEKKRQGHGLPNLIYVKRFSMEEGSVAEQAGKAATENSECNAHEVPEMEHPEVPESTSLDVPKSAPLNNNNNFIHNDYIKSIHPSMLSIPEERIEGTINDAYVKELTEIETYESYRQIVEENVNLELLERQRQRLDDKFNSDMISLEKYEEESQKMRIDVAHKVIDYMVEILSSKSTVPIRICDDFHSREMVKKKLLLVNQWTFRAVVEKLGMDYSIRNPKRYAISMLYNG